MRFPLHVPEYPSKPVKPSDCNSPVNTHANHIQSRITQEENNDHQEPLEIVDNTTKRNTSSTSEKYPQWRDLQKRINSFDDLPPQLRQSHQTLAKAGLFYTGKLVKPTHFIDWRGMGIHEAPCFDVHLVIIQYCVLTLMS